MVKRMLIDAAHPEETRVVVLSGNRLEEFDFETSTKKQIKGNIYLAKITRVEPSLQAAFVDFGGNRHGFLAFSEIHPDYFRIPVDDRSGESWNEERPAYERSSNERSGNERSGNERSGHERSGPERSAERPAPERPAERVAPEPSAEHPVAEATAEERPQPSERRRRRRPRAAESAAAAEEAAPLDAGASAEPETAEFVSAEFVSAEASPAESVSAESVSVETTPLESAPAADEPASDSAPATEAEPDAKPKRVRRPRAPRAKAEASEDEIVYAETTSEEDRQPPSEQDREPDHGDDEESLETLGGDEIEEVQRHRSRSLRSYKIQEVIKRRQVILVQVTKEERGNKGAALTTYLSLAGRYCVLMPNTGRGGGVSRKITSGTDRRRLKDMLEDLEIPDGMGVIVRTAGSERSKPEIKRDYEYLMRLWDEVRELTLKSSAPALIYEEGNLIKRSIRDLYSRDIDEVLVEGEEGYRTAKDFMKMLMPSHAKRVQPYRDVTVPLLHRFQVESQIDAIHSPIVQLRSGGYIVISPTEALVAIDVNSGRSTKERNIEETAYRTNIEAADEIARQLRLRDLAGLIVIDFIDMEETRNQATVERRVKDAMRNDRARIQIGRISPFGLLELSRQRLRPSLVEASTQPCPHCAGSGHIRSTESTALHVLRALEEEGMRHRSAEVCIYVPTSVALYILNFKHAALSQVEARCGFRVIVASDDDLIPPAFRLERIRNLTEEEIAILPPVRALTGPILPEIDDADEIPDEEDEAEETSGEAPSREPESREQGSRQQGSREQEGRESAPREGGEEDPNRRKRRRRRRRRGSEEGGEPSDEAAARENEDDGETLRTEDAVAEAGDAEAAETLSDGSAEDDAGRKRRRRGRRGGRRRGKGEAGGEEAGTENGEETGEEAGGEFGEAVDAAAAGQPEPVPESAPAIAAQAVEAPVLDAPILDAPVVDAPVLDAPVPEAPVIEATPEPAPVAAVELPPAAPEAVAAGPAKRGWWRR